jgi:hypothetical protein
MEMTHQYDDEQLDRALSYDALDEAEKVTGRSYKGDLNTSLTGFDLMLRNNQAKKQMLSSRNDAYFGIPLPDYEAIVADIGFKFQRQYPFRSSGSKQDELLKIWADPERAILLCYDTYRGGLNGGKYYYNVRMPRDRDSWSLTSSGHYNPDEGVWVGDHDCREAIRFHIEQFERHGEFVCPWVENPHVWLLHSEESRQLQGMRYGDEWRNYIDGINERRLGELPWKHLFQV